MTTEQIRELLAKKLLVYATFNHAVRELCLELQASTPHLYTPDEHDRTEFKFTIPGKMICITRYWDIPWDDSTGYSVSEVSNDEFSEKVEDDDPIAKSLSKEWINIVSSNDPCVHVWRMESILSEAYRYRNFLEGVESDDREYELPLPVNVVVGLAEFQRVGWLRNQNVQITENRRKPFRPIKEVHFPVHIIGFKTLCYISITKKKVTLICSDRKNVSVQLHADSIEPFNHQMRIAPFEQFIRMITILYKQVLPYEE